MNSPIEFIRARQQARIRKIAAEVIRISEAGGRSTIRRTSDITVSTATYRTMLDDDEVGSSLTLKELLMLPAFHVEPFDGDEMSKKSAQFIEEIHKRMNGTPLSIYRDMALHESLTTGLLVGELLFRDTEIPEFGKVKGLKTITVANSEDFIGNTVMDEFGNIEKFVQNRDGVHDFKPEEVVYYGYKAVSGNPEGISALRGAQRPWELKTKAYRSLKIFLATNAAGIWKMLIPPGDFKKEKDNALAFMAELAEIGSVAMPNDWKLDSDIPPGHAGIHFIQIIQQVCDKGIRKSILYDETVTAEQMHTWGSGGKDEAMNMVGEAMKAEGEEFAESFISEQVFRKILHANGMGNYPIPIASIGHVAKQTDPAVILGALGKAKVDGVLAVDLPTHVQTQIVERMVESIGIEYNASLDVLKTYPEQKLLQAASAPKGRMKSDILKSKKGRIRREKSSVGDTVNAWKEIVPLVSKRMGNALFKEGQWVSDNPVVLGEEIRKTIKTKGNVLREVMLKHMTEEWEVSFDMANASLPVSAVISTAPRINPVHAMQALRARVHVILEKAYAEMGADLYYQVESAILGATSPTHAQAQIEEYLRSGGFTPTRAGTILNTSMAQAHNAGRMSVYAPLQDPFGTDVGGIIGYEYSAVLDDRTSDLCELLNGEFFRCNDPRLPDPPLHQNCRSLLVPVFSGEVPWNGKEFNDFNQTQNMVSKYGGIPTGFGGA